MKFNKKMLLGTIATIIAGVFLIIAFFGLKFRFSMTVVNAGQTEGKGFTYNLKPGLDNFGTASDDPMAPSWMEAIYGCGIAGVVLMFLGVIYPLISMFYTNDRVNKYLGLGSLAFAGLGLILAVASVATFMANISNMSDLLDKELAWANITDDKKPLISTKLNAGYAAGQLIFIVVGGALALAGNSISYKEYLTK